MGDIFELKQGSRYPSNCQVVSILNTYKVLAVPWDRSSHVGKWSSKLPASVVVSLHIKRASPPLKTV